MQYKEIGLEALPRDPAMITAYHAHVYYDPQTTRNRAAVLRERLAAAFTDVRLGRWHDQPVGPHPGAMYQVAFGADRLAAILPWLMLNRLGLTVLVHPETGDAHADHTTIPTMPHGSALSSRSASKCCSRAVIGGNGAAVAPGHPDERFACETFTTESH